MYFAVQKKCAYVLYNEEHFIALHSTSLQYSTMHFITLHYNAKHYISLHYPAIFSYIQSCSSLHFTFPLQYTRLLDYIALDGWTAVHFVFRSIVHCRLKLCSGKYIVQCTRLLDSSALERWTAVH